MRNGVDIVRHRALVHLAAYDTKLEQNENQIQNATTAAERRIVNQRTGSTSTRSVVDEAAAAAATRKHTKGEREREGRQQTKEQQAERRRLCSLSSLSLVSLCAKGHPPACLSPSTMQSYTGSRLALSLARVSRVLVNGGHPIVVGHAQRSYSSHGLPPLTDFKYDENRDPAPELYVPGDPDYVYSGKVRNPRSYAGRRGAQPPPPATRACVACIVSVVR